LTRWFYKTTEPIPVVVEVNIPLGTIDGISYKVTVVNAGLNSNTGCAFINYSGFNGFLDWTFWLLHFHEFLHRFFWLLNWDMGHDILDLFDKKFWWASIIRDIRTGTTKVISVTKRKL